LNFVGKFDPGHASSHSGGPIDAVPHHGSTDAITIADAGLLFTGDFKRSGPDLVLSKDGHDLVVQDYFKGETRAALASPDGARLSGSIVDALTGHVEYAQADGSVAAAKVIGHVTKLAGSATAIRNGVSIQLNMGDNVDKGDVVQAGGGSSLGLTFIDGTVFGLSSNARMVLNEMVYDPNGSSNSSLLSLVQGTITFVAGETAKHGDMRVDTPTATMGIRGTAVLVEIAFDVPGQGNAPPVQFQVLVEPSGVTGSYVLYSKTTPGLVLGTVNQAGQITSVNGPGDISQSQAPPLTALEKLIIEQTFGLYFPNYVPNPNPQSTGPHGSTPANPPGSLIPEPQKFDDLPVGAPQLIPIKLPGSTQDSSPIIIPVTITVLKTIDVTPVVNKASFSIADQVTIQDSNPSDPIVKYVPGTAKILSVTVVGPGNVPAGVDLTKFIVVDPQTGAVSYDLARFAFLGENQKAIVTIGFDSSAGSDTFHSTLTETINGVNDAPVISAASLAVAEGGTVLFTAANLGIADPDSTSFTFTVSKVTHGTFQITTDGVNWTDATTFTSADLAAGHVRFMHNGGGDAPTFSIQADDGASANHLSNVFNGSIDFTHVNQPPVITAASLDVAEGGTVLFTPANLGITDPDSKTFTFTVSDVTHGTFQTTTNGEDWSDATSFTSADLAAGRVRFVHDGGEAAPTFSIQADDGASTNHLSNVFTGSVDFTNVNDPPVISATSIVTGAISVALPIGVLTPVGAAILTAPSGLISGLGTDTGYGILALAHGDDNSSGAIDITSVFGSAGIDFFGTHYTSLYINNNGNITFEAPNGAYTPTAINAGFHNPIIAAFWADVDTRGHGNVYYDEDAADGVMTITWDHVGYYNQRSDKLDSFQIVLINEGNGNFDILYRYGQMQWTTGDASGGTGGLGGTVARAGYSAGDGVHYFELPQSGNQAALLALPTTTGNTGIAGVDEFQVRNGEVGPTTVTKSGTINFADPDLTDTHHIASVKYTGTASQLGTLAVTLVTDTTGTGINGQFAWTYTADTAAVQAALLYTNDGSQIATFDVVIDDGHGGVVTQTVAVTLTASNADVWNGHGDNASWNTPGNWSLGHAPTAAEVAYVDTKTTLNLDVNHLSDASVGGLHVSSQSEIDLTASGHAGSFAVDGALINLGHILLTDNTTLEASGAIHNNGTITIDAAAAEGLHGASPGATLLIDGTVMLDGHGTITLDGTNDRITGTHGETTTSTLENVDNVINGFGKLGDDHLHLINDAAGIIDATGLLTIDTDHTITNNGLLEAATGGTLVIDDAVVGAGSEKIGAGAVLEFGSSVASTQTVTFEGSSGTLKLDDPTHFAADISGLKDSDGIDLAGFDANAKVTWQSTATSTVLTVTDEHHSGHNAVNITLLGDYTDSAFTISSDHHGGVLIVDPPATPSSTTVEATGINQTLTGTGPRDNFVFDFANVGQATVTNFHADTDLLQLNASLFANAQAALDATQDDGHGNAVIALDAHDSITLTGVTKAQLHQADFHLV
jgi:hypothetical protein